MSRAHRILHERNREAIKNGNPIIPMDSSSPNRRYSPLEMTYKRSKYLIGKSPVTLEKVKDDTSKLVKLVISCSEDVERVISGDNIDVIDHTKYPVKGIVYRRGRITDLISIDEAAYDKMKKQKLV